MATIPSGVEPQEPSKPSHLDDLLDEADEESLPASDPPAVTPRREPVTKQPEVPG